MRLGELELREVAERLRRGTLALATGPLTVRLRTAIPGIASRLHLLYAEFPLAAPDAFADFDVALERPLGLRRWLRPQVRFRVDTEVPFRPLPLRQAWAMLEWGLNWCVYAKAHWWLVVHAAVVARGQRALLLPGHPGSGKSTLAAALVSRGWRLLSDELALIDPASGAVSPLPRPVSLKNESIDLIRAFDPEAVLCDPVPTDGKGLVAHCRPPSGAVARQHEPARAAWVICPRVQPAAAGAAQPLTPGRTLMALAEAAVNYGVHGEAGFDCLARIAAAAPAWRLAVGDLEQAVARVDELTGSLAARPVAHAG